MIAFPLTAVLVLHTGPLGMALITAIGAPPSLLFSVPVGAWIERRGSRRLIMIAADLCRFLLLTDRSSTLIRFSEHSFFVLS